MHRRRITSISQSLQREVAGIVFLLPGFLFVFVFMLYPIIHSFYLSLTKYNFTYDKHPTFIGINNYIQIFKDQYFIESFTNTALFSLLFFPSVLIISLAIAILLNHCLKGKNFFRSSVFLPVIVPISLAGIIFQWLLNENHGLINFFLHELMGLDFLPRNWLSNKMWALPSIVIVSLWKFTGIEVLLFLSGLQAIPKELYEAAKVDGANPFHTLFMITLPNLRETFIISSIWAIIISVKVFELPFIMTQGGPGTSTLVLYQHVWNNAFSFYDMGYASAIGFFMGFLILLLSLLNFHLGKED